MRRLFYCAAALCMAFSSLAVSATERPNIVLILADNLGYGDVGYLGGKIPTPALDQLAGNSVRLKRFYAEPVGTATRTSLMTGRDPIRLGLTYAELSGWDNLGVHPQEHFISQSFKQAGYQTGVIGTWGLGHAQQTFHPNERGFDTFWGQLLTSSDQNAPYHNLGGVDLQYNGKRVNTEGFLPSLTPQQATRYITEREKEKPFFLYLPFGSDTSSRSAYENSVLALDKGINSLVATLKNEKVLANTIILFLSDSGAKQGIGSNGVFSGGYGETLEGGLRVPAFISWPDKLSGSDFTGIVTAADVFPTLARAAGVSPANQRSLDGLDQWSAIHTNKPLKDSRTLFFASELKQYGSFQVAALTREWKLVQHIDQGLIDINVSNHLYKVTDGVVDETENLASRQPKVVEKLAEDIVIWRAKQPITGLRNNMVPSLGWRGPVDWAAYPLPLNLLQEKTAAGVPPPIARRPLDFQLGEKGRLIYDCEMKWWSLGFCLTEVEEDIKEYAVYK